MDFVLLTGFLIPVVGIPYAWSEWYGKVFRSIVTRSERVAAEIGIFAITLQALFYFGLWTRLARELGIVTIMLSAEFLLLLVALPCVFKWTSKARWWVLASSICLLMDASIVALTSYAD
jgi:hypothetical protein